MLLAGWFILINPETTIRNRTLARTVRACQINLLLGWLTTHHSSLITHHLFSVPRRRHVCFADVEVGGNFLHVVVIFQRFHQLQHLFGLGPFELLVLDRKSVV